MVKKMRLIVPSMPNFIFLDDGEDYHYNSHKSKIHISDLTEAEAEEYSELLKNNFLEHWKNLKEGNKDGR